MERAWQALVVPCCMAGTATAAPTERWLHVKVERGKKGEMVRINVPLSLGEKVLPIITHGNLHEGEIHIGEAETNGASLRALLDALCDASANEYVNLKDSFEDIRVARSAGGLVVHVRD